jgi:hypothetical protein
MSLTPFSRENMRSLKAQMDKEINDMKIDSAVKFIYVNAVYFAETKADTVYRHLLNAHSSHGGHITPISNVAKYATQYNQTYGISKEYVLENMEEILTRLRTLFPGCFIEYKKTSMVKGRDGKEYDISETNDKLLLQLFDTRNVRIDEYIRIDWS